MEMPGGLDGEPEGERLEVMFPWAVVVAAVWSMAVAQESLAGS
jgi:hypothetical protein